MNHPNIKARIKLLYAAPLAIASTALAVSVVAPQIARASTPNLAPVSPNQLVSWIKSTSPIPLNGTVSGTTSFPVPSASLLNSSNPESALSGSTTESYNVWTNGSGSFRAQQVSQAGETDLYVTPGSAWLWNSVTLTATNEAHSGSGANGYSLGSNPGATASEIVSRLSAYSTLSVSGNTMVAGRPAYTLSIVPTAGDSLIGSIQIAVDGQTHIPVQVQVFPNGSAAPAASLGYVTLQFASQPSSIFSFSPPVGARVVNPTQNAAQNGNKPGSVGSAKVVGSGFDSVMVATGFSKVTSTLGGLEKSLPVISTPLGSGHLYSTPIFEAIILPSGAVVAGAVDTSRLLQVVAGL